MEYGGIYMSTHKSVKKALCPFGRHCFTCEHIGQYLECPLTFQEKIYSEIREGRYQGLDPYTLLRRVRLSE